jgi:8-oxo-dGTP pyrophosphatase MutT (NUDIX family)
MAARLHTQPQSLSIAKKEMSQYDAASLTVADLERLRKRLRGGDALSGQSELVDLVTACTPMRAMLRPESDEPLRLVDSAGGDRDVVSPRWLCHLLGLRHRCVHVLLLWPGERLGRVFVLQIRNWAKSDSPGHLDISVGGHVTDGPQAVVDSAYREMKEELGLTKGDLTGDGLVFQQGYEFGEERPVDSFYNTEWRDVYCGELRPEGLARIEFSDDEVVGLHLCPVSEASRMLRQTVLPLASGLRESLPRCLT